MGDKYSYTVFSDTLRCMCNNFNKRINYHREGNQYIVEVQ